MRQVTAQVATDSAGEEFSMNQMGRNVERCNWILWGNAFYSFDNVGHLSYMYGFFPANLYELVQIKTGILKWKCLRIVLIFHYSPNRGSASDRPTEYKLTVAISCGSQPMGMFAWRMATAATLKIDAFVIEGWIIHKVLGWPCNFASF